jgi:predicted GTPase
LRTLRLRYLDTDIDIELNCDQVITEKLEVKDIERLIRKIASDIELKKAREELQLDKIWSQ